MISQEFKNALKLQSIPKYRLAWQAGISPGILNHLINGHQLVQDGDLRLIRIAQLIGFPPDKVFRNPNKKLKTPVGCSRSRGV